MDLIYSILRNEYSLFQFYVIINIKYLLVGSFLDFDGAFGCCGNTRRDRSLVCMVIGCKIIAEFEYKIMDDIFGAYMM